MKHLRVILLVVLVLVLASLACSLGTKGPASEGQTGAPPAATEPAAAEGQTSPTQAPAVETQPAVAEATQAPSGETEQPPATEMTEAPAEGGAEESTLDLGTSMSGLQNLNSYRTAWRFDWNGTKGGQPVTGYMEMHSAYVREPQAQELYFEGKGLEAGADQGLGKVAFIQVGDTAWFYEGQSDTWMQVPGGDLDFSQGLFFKPEDLLSDFDSLKKGRRSLLPQQVNGVQCYKYTFTEKDFDLAGSSEGVEVKRAQGEVYVAVEGDYVVRMLIDADFHYSDPQQIFEDGTMKMNFDISEVNQPITIKPPAEAEAQTRGREDIPILPDAKVEISSPELISYRTASSISDAAQFYQDEMPQQGWAAEEGNTILDETAFLNYNKDNEKVSIIVGSDDQGTTVFISITKE